jgi:hypothetical protein
VADENGTIELWVAESGTLARSRTPPGSAHGGSSTPDNAPGGPRASTLIPSGSFRSNVARSVNGSSDQPVAVSSIDVVFGGGHSVWLWLKRSVRAVARYGSVLARVGQTHHVVAADVSAAALAADLASRRTPWLRYQQPTAPRLRPHREEPRQTCVFLAAIGPLNAVASASQRASASG